MRVKDIMVKKVITLNSEMNAKDAMHKLQERKISGLPVVDDDNKVVGMLTEKSILMAILPSYVKKVGHFVYDVNSKKLIDRIEKLNELKVKDIMRKEIITATEDTSLTEIARIMLTQKIRRIPVVEVGGSFYFEGGATRMACMLALGFQNIKIQYRSPKKWNDTMTLETHHFRGMSVDTIQRFKQFVKCMV